MAFVPIKACDPAETPMAFDFRFDASKNAWIISAIHAPEDPPVYLLDLVDWPDCIRRHWGVEPRTGWRLLGLGVDDAIRLANPAWHAQNAALFASQAVCPDCRGTREYRGLLAVEDCRTCAGSGRVWFNSAGDPMPWTSPG